MNNSKKSKKKSPWQLSGKDPNKPMPYTPSTNLDDNGDDTFLHYNEKNVADRNADTLVGLTYGVIADGVVNQDEAEFIRSWLVRNQANETIMMRKLRGRLSAMLSDGVLDKHEAKELITLLRRFTGNPDLDEAAKTTTLPLCEPLPDVDAEGVFCFTGKCAYGGRMECEAEVLSRGRKTVSGITKKLDYLVLGDFVSPSWKHETHGRKIEKAMEYRDKFGTLCIISEHHWQKQLGLC